MKNIIKRTAVSALTLTMLLTAAACGSTPTKTETAANQPETSTTQPADINAVPAPENVETQPSAQPLVLTPVANKDDFAAALACESMDALYHHVKITGTELPLEQVYSVKDLIELAGYGLDKAELEGLCVTAEADIKGKTSTVYGLDLAKLLELCGANMSEPQRIKLNCDDEECKFAFDKDTSGVLVLAVDGEVLENGVGLLVDSNGTIYAENVDFIMFGSCCDNPHYEMHNRSPHDLSADITFTFNVYKGDKLENTVTYTTKELEAMAEENPDAVYGGYYGVIGDKESFVSMGGGGFLDYFEGLRFDWLMKEKLGITDFNGYAELYSREDELYATVEDISYFTKSADEYYMCTSDGDVITGLAVPTLAYAKNGSPLLPEHEHDSDAYVSKTPVKKTLGDMGIEEINLGTVKNHSGPFVAALGDCEGYYGGYQIETGADCVRMDIHLN